MWQSSCSSADYSDFDTPRQMPLVRRLPPGARPAHAVRDPHHCGIVPPVQLAKARHATGARSVDEFGVCRFQQCFGHQCRSGGTRNSDILVRQGSTNERTKCPADENLSRLALLNAPLPVSPHPCPSVSSVAKTAPCLCPKTFSSHNCGRRKNLVLWSHVYAFLGPLTDYCTDTTMSSLLSEP